MKSIEYMQNWSLINYFKQRDSLTLIDSLSIHVLVLLSFSGFTQVK